MKKLVGVISVLVLLFTACEDAATPKPHGYPRIDLPERTYSQFNPDCPFTFRSSSASTLEGSEMANCFYNITYPQYNATIHLTYVTIKNDLKQLIDQEYMIKEKHNQFASSVKERLYQDQAKKVNALIFNINGTKAATPLQFFITDSVEHFFRGVLYFNNTPNNDSLQPVIDYIKEDVDSLVESFEWR